MPQLLVSKDGWIRTVDVLTPHSIQEGTRILILNNRENTTAPMLFQRGVESEDRERLLYEIRNPQKKAFKLAEETRFWDTPVFLEVSI